MSKNITISKTHEVSRDKEWLIREAMPFANAPLQGHTIWVFGYRPDVASSTKEGALKWIAAQHNYDEGNPPVQGSYFALYKKVKVFDNIMDDPNWRPDQEDIARYAAWKEQFEEMLVFAGEHESKEVIEDDAVTTEVGTQIVFRKFGVSKDKIITTRSRSKKGIMKLLRKIGRLK